MLIMADEHGRATTLGSGFFVAEGVVATNVHVIEDAAKGYVRFCGQKRRYRVEKVVGVDEAHDLALLKISGAHARRLPLGDSARVTVGDEVYAVGNPEGFDGTFSNGIVSGIRRERSDTLIQITAPISHGSSGGPVLNARGEVIGIAVACVEDGQNLNFAIPSACLAKLLKASDLPPASKAPARQSP